MKKLNILLLAFLCFGITNLETRADALVQVVHNSADPAAETVDIYVNGLKPTELDDISFRGATSYLPVPDNTSLTITIAGPTSIDVTDQVVANISIGQLEDNTEYVLVANGVLGDNFNNPDPNNRSIGFDLYALSGDIIATSENVVSVSAFHGSTDAPAVDIYTDITGEPFIPGLDYGDFSGWVEVPSNDLTLTVTPAGNKNVVLKEYLAPIGAIGGSTAFIFASGFLSPNDEPGMPEGREFGLFAALSSGFVLELPEQIDLAQVQVIHNAADPSVETVDIYVNGTKLDELDDISFREATPYLTVPANTSLTITVAGASSMNVNDAKIQDFVLGPLETDMEYVAVANGVAGQGFMNPDEMNRSIEFDLYPLGGSTMASSDDKVNIVAWHGATDAPAVDIYTDLTMEPFIPNLDYGNATDWVEVDNSDLTLTVTAASDASLVVGNYAAPLSALGGESLFIMASGFLTPDDESGMPMNRDFGLFAVTAGGDVIKLDDGSGMTAKLQAIHNAADPAGETVDIYFNGMKPDEFDDLMFRDATPFVDVPAGVSGTITIAGATSMNAMDQVIEEFEFEALEAGMDYILVANGVVSDGFNNPDEMNRNISFNLYGGEGERMASSDNLVNISVFHGVTDAPAVDIYTDLMSSPLIPDLDYGDMTDWTELPNDDVDLTVTASGDNSIVVGTYDAPLSLFGGESLFIFASGFLTPNDEPGMPMDRDFGLFVATADGNVVRLGEAIQNAKVQVIHNAADPVATTVDIYVNGQKADDLDNLSFREATAYLPVPSNESLTITVAGASSMDVMDQVVGTFEVGPLETGREYVVVANGVIQGGFNNPDEMNREIGFNLYPVAGSDMASSDSKVNIAAFHGATDAPAVDIYTDIAGNPLIPGLDYGMISSWVEVDNMDIELTVTAAGDKSVVAGTYDVPLSQLGGQSAFIFASGFLTPGDEQNSPMDRDFTLMVAFADGTTIDLSLISSVAINDESTNLYPNPTNGEFTIESENSFDMVKIFGINGELLFEEEYSSIRSQVEIQDLGVSSGNLIVVTYNNNVISSVNMQIYNK